MRSGQSGMKNVRAALAAAMLFGSLAVGAPGLAAAAEDPADVTLDEGGARPADLVIANRYIYTMRAEAYGATPEERAQLVSLGVSRLVDEGGPLEVTTRPSPDAIAVLIDGKVVFRIRSADLNPESGETLQDVAAAAVQNLGKSLDDMKEARDAGRLLPAAGYSLLATLALAGVVWGLLRFYAWASRRVHGLVQRRFARAMPDWAGHVMGEAGLAGLFTLPLRLLIFLLVALAGYRWAAFVLTRFPYTRPWGEALLHNLLRMLGRLGEALIDSLPGLVFVVLIFVVTRIVVRAVRAFFNGVQLGRIRVGMVDETTARPTGQLIVTGIWILALVAAYPYIPGSGSEAFKGIGVFVGLMMSIGASGVVNQAVSGLMLMYTRALRPGEFVRIGETEGTVKSVGFVTTRIETLRHEEVSIPNAIIVSSVTHNYSRLAAEGGVWVATKVTIGYDTPWRQVHGLLELAAERTAGIARDPAPRVRQTALQDFYVEYTLLVSIADPAQRVVTLDQLHANILDAFNEFGVQITSPNYEADPESPKVVPREKWYAPPAAR